MVCIPFGGDGPTVRVDLPDSPDEVGPWVREQTDIYLDLHHPARVALVAYGEDPRRPLEVLAELGYALTRAGGQAAAEIAPMLWVNGDEWAELLSGTSGTVDASVRARINAEFALRGRVMPVASREDLAVAMKGDPSTVAQLLPTAWQRFGDLDRVALLSEAEWLGKRLDRFGRDREYLSDAAAARVLVAISDTRICDAAGLGMKCEDAPVFSEFWQDLVRRAPAEVRDAPVTLLALTSFLEGRGAQAWVALDELSAPNEMGNLVADALTRATDPREWDKTKTSAVAAAQMQRAALRTAAQLRRESERPVHQEPPRLTVADPDASGPALGHR